MPQFLALITCTETVCHNTLFYYVKGIRGDPEDLGAEAARPEIDGGRRKGCVIGEEACEDVVGTPPEEEERTKK